MVPARLVATTVSVHVARRVPGERDDAGLRWRHEPRTDDECGANNPPLSTRTYYEREKRERRDHENFPRELDTQSDSDLYSEFGNSSLEERIWGTSWEHVRVGREKLGNKLDEGGVGNNYGLLVQLMLVVASS